MDLSFTDDQRSLRDLARAIFDAASTRERLAEVDAGPERFDRALWSDLARANLLGAGIDDQWGGIGGDVIEQCVLLEEAGRAATRVPLWSAFVAAATVQRFGTAEQRSRWLPAIVDGREFPTAALTEAAADDPCDASTTATPLGDGWRLNGVKTGVPWAHVSAVVVVPARTPDGVRLFLVETRETELERQVATSGEPQARMTLNGTHGGPLGDESAAEWIRDRALTTLCAVQVGLAESALSLTAEYVSGREQFGKPLGAFQAVKQRAADAYIDVEAMRWTMWQAAWCLSEGLPAAEEVAIAKAWASEGGHRVLAAAQHLHGGMGVDMEYPLHRFTLAAKGNEMTLGSASRQLARLGDLMAEPR